MVKKAFSHKRRFRLIAAGILAVGLVSAAWIYRGAPAEDGGGALGYEVVDGKSYPITPGESKSSEFQVERIGGKSAVAGAEFNTWFGSLWRGRTLATSVAILSAGASLLCFVFSSLRVAPVSAKS